MKRIYNILFAVSALIAFSPAMLADDPPGEYSINGQINETVDGQKKYLEWPKDNGVHQSSDFAYSKDISSPQSDGTYWIKLESFSTGSASFIESAAPADIVLVLDLSSSMVNNYVSYRYDYYEYTPNRGHWRATDSYNDTYYEYNGNYYQVSVYHANTNGGTNGTQYYCLVFDDGSVTHYLLHGKIYNSWSQVPKNNNNNGTNDNIWPSALFRYGQVGDETRLDALKRAVCGFIDVIEINDKYEDEAGTIERKIGGVPTRLGNRISIITFWSTPTVVTTLEKGQLGDVSDNTHSTAAELKALVMGFDNGTGTRPDLGIAQANGQFSQYVDEARKLAASRTVVVFTDGEPYPNTNNANYNTAINAAHTSKSTHDATVFTVGLFTNEPAPQSNLWTFMNLMSSNAPNATSMTNTGANYDPTKGFYKDASAENADLSAVFTEIAHQSGGSATTLSAASSNVDVVSNSFILPEGADAEHIGDYVKIFIAKLEKIDNGNYVFYEEILKGHTPTVENPTPQDAIDGYYYYPLDPDGNRVQPEVLTKVDANISVTFESPNKIKVTGFDYSSNFCGPVYLEGYTDDDHIDHYQGFKIIIMIPIKMNPDAVGGPDVKTNGPGSGIFVSNESSSAFVAYESPTVSLPVNIHITKKGLQEGESAKFRIERAVLPANGPLDYSTLTWSYVSTVFVTKSKGSTEDPIVKVRGLPANTDVKVDETTTIHQDFVYRVSEEPWSWSYDAETEPKYTNVDYMDNPIDFTNTKKPNIEVKVRHAESKATNVFVTGSTVKYDDSKDNGR